MKKTNKKQIPKVRLPKYSPGGSHKFNESMYDSSQSTSTQDTKDAYNEKRSSGISNQQKAAAAQSIFQGGMEAYSASQDPYKNDYQKTRAIQAGADTAKVGVASAINPALGMAVGAVTKVGGMAQNKLSATDEYGNIKNTGGSKAGEVVGGLLSPSNSLIGIYSDPKATTGQKVAGALTGGISDMFTSRHKNQVESSAKADIVNQKAQQEAANQQQIAAQQQQQSMMDASFERGMANYNQNNPQGGGGSTLQYGKYGGQMKFAMGGMQYANGGTGQINSEVEGGGYNEDGENAVAPNGEFTQFNGPTHAQGGIQTDMAPGTRIFSAKLNPVGSKKSFAKLNESNNTNREDKLEAKGNLDPKSKTSIDLTRMAKMKNSDMLFAMQEQLKKDKVAAYAKKMGVELPSMDNEQMEPQGMSEQSEGEMPMVKHGGRFALGGVQLPYYNTDRNGNPKYTMGGFNDDPTLTPATTSTVTPPPPPVKLPTDFKSRNEFDTYMKSQPGYARDPRNKSGVNVGYYPTSKYKYNEGTNTFSNIGDTLPGSTTVNFGSIPSSDFMEYTPKIGRPTPTANWQTNQLLRGGGNKLTFPSGDTQIVAPKKVLAYGGKMPKYVLGGKEDGDNELGYTPNNPAEADRMQQAAKMNNARYSQKSSYSPNVLPWEKTNDSENTPNNPYVNSKVNPYNNIDWSKTDKFGNLFNFIGQNAGNIYDLTRKNEPLQKYERAKASYLDNTAAMRDAEQEARRDEYAVRGASGGKAGTYLANRVGLNTAKVMNKDRIRQQYANASAQIGNQNAQFNAEIAYREAEARAKDAAIKENVRSQAIASLGSSFGKATKSGKQDNIDQDTLKMFQWRYKNEPEFKKYIDNFGN